MFADRSVITNSPPEVAFPDLCELHDNLAPEAQVRLSEIESHLLATTSEEALSDDEIIDITHESSQFYVNWFGSNLSSALEYLEQSGYGIEGEGTGGVRPNEAKRVESIQSRFSTALRDECLSMDVDPETLPVGEAEQLLRKRSEALARGLRASYDRFSMLATSFGNPDVLRAEAGAGASAALSGLVERLEKLGDRPDEDTRRKKIGAFFTGSINMTRDQFDRESTERLSRFKVPTTASLLKDYIQMAMVHYGKLTFGEMPLVLDRGFQSDPLVLRDLFQARMDEDTATRPRFPLEAATSLGEDLINEILFSDDSQISRLLDNGGSSFQQSSRQYRKQYTVRHSSGAWAAGKPFEDEFDASDTLGDADLYGSQAEKGARVQRLDGVWFNYYITFDRLLSRLKIASEDRPKITPLVNDFLKRLEGRPVDQHGTPISFDRLLIRAMRELHPDSSVVKPAHAEQLFKFYCGLRNLTQDKNAHGFERHAYD